MVKYTINKTFMHACMHTVLRKQIISLYACNDNDDNTIMIIIMIMVIMMEVMVMIMMMMILTIVCKWY